MLVMLYGHVLFSEPIYKGLSPVGLSYIFMWRVFIHQSAGIPFPALRGLDVTNFRYFTIDIQTLTRTMHRNKHQLVIIFSSDILRSLRDARREGSRGWESLPWIVIDLMSNPVFGTSLVIFHVWTGLLFADGLKHTRNWISNTYQRLRSELEQLYQQMKRDNSRLQGYHVFYVYSFFSSITRNSSSLSATDLYFSIWSNFISLPLYLPGLPPATLSQRNTRKLKMPNCRPHRYWMRRTARYCRATLIWMSYRKWVWLSFIDLLPLSNITSAL